MRDPNIQDALEDDLKTIQYNKAIKALIPVVELEYVFFDSVVIDYFSEEYSGYTEGWMKHLHNEFLNHNFFACQAHAKLHSKWQERVQEEAQRRVDG